MGQLKSAVCFSGSRKGISWAQVWSPGTRVAAGLVVLPWHVCGPQAAARVSAALPSTKGQGRAQAALGETRKQVGCHGDPGRCGRGAVTIPWEPGLRSSSGDGLHLGG